MAGPPGTHHVLRGLLQREVYAIRGDVRPEAVGTPGGWREIGREREVPHPSSHSDAPRFAARITRIGLTARL